MVPDPPDWLHEYAKQEWVRVSAELHNLGVLTVLDETTLSAYCQCYARWREAEEQLDGGTVDVFRDANTGEVKHTQPKPQISISKGMQSLMRQWASEFGLTPVARSRLGASGKNFDKPADPMETMLNG